MDWILDQVIWIQALAKTLSCGLGNLTIKELYSRSSSLHPGILMTSPVVRINSESESNPSLSQVTKSLVCSLFSQVKLDLSSP